jgi:ribosome-associated protein
MLFNQAAKGHFSAIAASSNQLLKMVGLCDSGGAGKALVAEGIVSVDGHMELRKTAKIRSGVVVTLGDVEISVVAAVE